MATFLAAAWPNVTRTPWPEADPLLHHYIVAWPQSWYVDECTEVLCYATPLRAPLQAFCARRGGGVGGGAALLPSRRGAAVDPDEEGCAAIRRLYDADWALYQRHCT